MKQNKQNKAGRQNKDWKKNIRRIIQWSFFALFITAFIPPVSNKIRAVTDSVINIQFFPSLIRAPLTAAVIILLTLLFGRIYCSSVCPLASVHDLFSFRKKKYRYRKLKKCLRYTVPLVSLFLLAAGFPSLSSLFDPYSLTGRIILFVNRILFVPLVKITALILRQFSIYIPESDFSFNYFPLITAVPFLILLIIMAGKRGRLYCNTLCPVGALLSVFSGFSLFSVKIQKDRCTACGACEQVCKAEAIDSASRTVDASKCISCFNCISVCSFDAVGYGKNENPVKKMIRSFDKLIMPAAYRKKRALSSADTDNLKGSKDGAGSGKTGNSEKEYSSNGRRDFLRTAAAGSVLLVSSLLLRQKSHFFRESGRIKSVPPGAGSRINLLSKCTRLYSLHK